MFSVFKYSGEYRKNTIIAIILIMLSIPIGIIPYFFLSNLINSYLDNNATLQGVLISSTWIFMFFSLKHILNGLGLSQSHKGAYGTLYKVRTKLANDLTKQPLGEILENGTGKYKKGFVEEVGRLELILAHIIPEGIPNLITPILVIITVFFIDWRMGFLSLASIPIGAVAMMIMFKIGMKTMPEYYASGSRLNSTIVEYISGMEVIKIFGQTTESYKRYADAVKNYKDKTLKWCKDSWLPMSIVYSALPCTILLTLPIGILFHLHGSLEISTLILILMLDLSIASPLTRIIQFMPMIPQVKYTMKQIEAIFSTPDVQCGNETTLPKSYDVSFENVTFAYGETDVLENVSFSAKQNQLTALVGESGSGKSTLSKLLVHFWDVKSGSVKIGGKDIRNFTFETLMSMTSFVAQDTFLFKGTIAENICMGKLNATNEEIVTAAKAASIHEFIMSLPNGYQSDVGGLGSKLSGGEKQRITLARAILKDAPIIVLDEATAYADAENEDLIQSAVKNLIKNKTVIVIAHRLGTIKDANSIVVLKNGTVNGVGKHNKLLKECSLYKKLWERSQIAENWSLAVKEVNINA